MCSKCLHVPLNVFAVIWVILAFAQRKLNDVLILSKTEVYTDLTKHSMSETAPDGKF